MKILSTGDWHWNGGFDSDILDSVNQIIDYVSSNEIDLISITGDVYDRSSEPGSRNLAAECIQKLADHAGVLIVKGNHDASLDLPLLSKLEACYSILVDETPQTRECENIFIHTLPWLTKSRWQSVHPNATKEEGDKTVSQLALEYLRNNVVIHPMHKHILIAHLTIAGAKCQTHQQMGADGIVFGQYDLQEAGFYAAMLGHIHLRQTISDNERFYYNGSIAALDYGENPNKFFSILDTKIGNVEWVRLNTIHRQDVIAEWTPTGVKIEEFPDEFINGARVRVNLRVEGGDNVDVAKEQVEKNLKERGALEIKINPQVIAVSKVRAVEISKAISLSDKLRQYWIATDAMPDEVVQKSMLDRLSELEDSCSL